MANKNGEATTGCLFLIIVALLICGCIYKCVAPSSKSDSGNRKEITSQQNTSKAEAKYIGSWSRYAIQNSDGDKISASSIASNTPIPDKVYVNKDGTGYFKVSGGRKDSFTWTVSNGKLNISMNGKYKGYMTKSGSIGYSQAAIVKGKVRTVYVFFSKD